MGIHYPNLEWEEWNSWLWKSDTSSMMGRIGEATCRRGRRDPREGSNIPCMGVNPHEKTESTNKWNPGGEHQTRWWKLRGYNRDSIAGSCFCDWICKLFIEGNGEEVMRQQMGREDWSVSKNAKRYVECVNMEMNFSLLDRKLWLG